MKTTTLFRHASVRWRVFAGVFLSVIIAAGCGGPTSDTNESEAHPEPAKSDGAAPAEAAPKPGQSTTAEPSPEPNQSTAEETESEIPQVVAKVGGDEITRKQYVKELEARRRALVAQRSLVSDISGRQIKPPKIGPETRRQVLQFLIRRKMTANLAEEDGLTITEEDIDKRIEEGKGNLQSEQNYAMYMQWFGLTEPELRAQLKEQMLAEQYVNRVTQEQCEVTEEQIKARYNELKEAGQVTGPEEVDFWHVMLTVDKNAPESKWQAAKEEIELIRQQVLEGADRAEIAAEYSDDPQAKRNKGFYEPMRRGYMSPDVEMVLFNAPIGELMEPLRTDYGWHIIEVLNRVEEGERSLEQVRDQVRELLLAECRQEKLAAILADAESDMKVEVYYEP